jgi:nucleoside-diphosphate-sugar epimerase
LTFVTDTVNGFLGIAGCDEALGRVTNVGFGKAISIGDLAGTVIGMINPRAQIVTRTERVRPDGSEVMKLLCSYDDARRMFGWEPQVGLQEGLQRTIEFVRDNLAHYTADRYAV